MNENGILLKNYFLYYYLYFDFDLMVKCYAHEEKKRPGFNEIIDCLKKMKLPKDFIYVPK